MNPAAAADLAIYPKYEQAYLRAFDRMIANNRKNGIKMHENWKDAKGVMNWWLNKSDIEETGYEEETI